VKKATRNHITEKRLYKAWYQGKIKMSAISKEKIKIRVLTKIQDIWTE
jgi:hypothetical protein